MGKVKKFLGVIFTKQFFKKLFAYILLIILIYFFKDFLGIFLLTFIFSFLFFSFATFLEAKIQSFVDRHVNKNPWLKSIKRILSVNTIITIEYLLFIGAIVFILSDLLPKLISELSDLTKNIPFLTDQISTINEKLTEIKNNYSEIGGTITQVINNKDFEVVIQIFDKLKTAGLIFLQVILALILSFVFLMDRKKLRKYLQKVRNSNFNFLYREYKILLQKVVLSFGLILKAQSLIASANAVITMVGFYVIGLFFGGFPYLLTLTLIVFLCSFIPILGMWISGIPLVFIAYATGGFEAASFVLLMVLFTSMLEAYYLNPKIVSSFLELPVSLTFVILIISEHFFGIAGLLIGVSMFYFTMGLMEDFDGVLSKTGKKLKNIE